MTFRLVPITLAIFGILACPLVCRDFGGRACAGESKVDACCCHASDDRDSDHAPLSPVEDECGIDCACKGVLADAQKPRFEFSPSNLDAPVFQANLFASAGGRGSVSLGGQSSSERTSGVELRLELASLLL